MLFFFSVKTVAPILRHPPIRRNIAGEFFYSFVGRYHDFSFPIARLERVIPPRREVFREGRCAVETPQEFVERYRGSWEQVMSGRVGIASMTKFFNVPCLMIGAEGTISSYSTPESIQSFNQSRLDVFNAGGATKARLRGYDVTTLGHHCALAVVNWELCRADGSVERAWRHYYNLLRNPDGWRIVLSAFQMGS